MGQSQSSPDPYRELKANILYLHAFRHALDLVEMLIEKYDNLSFERKTSLMFGVFGAYGMPFKLSHGLEQLKLDDQIKSFIVCDKNKYTLGQMHKHLIDSRDKLFLHFDYKTHEEGTATCDIEWLNFYLVVTDDAKIEYKLKKPSYSLDEYIAIKVTIQRQISNVQDILAGLRWAIGPLGKEPREYEIGKDWP
jgi:hypothetical protein